uniref:Uncharacterized protein n=1 Tax=Macaca fascicularis TaxID=9541 RepID=Q95LR7_MACFA|nr:hypothetical protein [Macaca fascicularis]
MPAIPPKHGALDLGNIPRYIFTDLKSRKGKTFRAERRNLRVLGAPRGQRGPQALYTRPTSLLHAPCSPTLFPSLLPQAEPPPAAVPGGRDGGAGPRLSALPQQVLREVLLLPPPCEPQVLVGGRHPRVRGAAHRLERRHDEGAAPGHPRRDHPGEAGPSGDSSVPENGSAVPGEDVLPGVFPQRAAQHLPGAGAPHPERHH